MVWWLDAVIALPEELGSPLSAHMAVHNHLTPVSGDLTPSSGLQGTDCMCMVHITFIHAGKASIHIKLLINLKPLNRSIWEFA